MNLNSQYEFYPAQPDNPTDEERYSLLKYALTQLGWPEDMAAILKRMAPPPPVTALAPPGSFRGIRVGVIGGGLAGLAAAYELRKMGFDITVFDALTDRVGGRVYTYHFSGDPAQHGEFGPMRVPVSHETVWHYLRLFDLRTYPFIQFNPSGFVYLKDTRVRNDRDGGNVRTLIYPKYDLKPHERATSWQKLLSLGTDSHLLRATTRERIEILEVKERYAYQTLEWQGRSNITMMANAGLSQGAINLVSNFSPLLEGNLYSSFIDYIQEDYPADMSYLYAIEGGTSRLPSAFYESFFDSNPYPELPDDIPGRVRYMPGCIVLGIYSSGGGRSVTLRYRRLDTREFAVEPFDYVVCAIPFSTLRNVEIAPLFSSLKMRAIREVNYTPAQKTLILCASRFWEAQGIVGGPSLTDLPIGSVWYPSDHARLLRNPADLPGSIGRVPPGEPGVLIGSYNFNLDTTRLLNQPGDILLDDLKRELAAVHGLPAEALDRTVVDARFVNWNQESAFRGGISFFMPGQKRLFAYAMAQPEFSGRIFFAGEHISAAHRWMQGALQTGMQAAGDLVRACARIT